MSFLENIFSAESWMLKHLNQIDKEFIKEIEYLKELDKSFHEIAELAIKAGDSWKKEHFDTLNQYATKIYELLYEDKYRIKRIKARFKELDRLLEISFQELLNNASDEWTRKRKVDIERCFKDEGWDKLRAFLLSLPDNLLKSFDYYFKNEHGKINFKEEKLDELVYAVSNYLQGFTEMTREATKLRRDVFYNLILKDAIEQVKEVKDKKIAENLVIKDIRSLEYDEDISFHRIPQRLLPNVLRYGILSHYMHLSIFGTISSGSSGGWDRTNAYYQHAIATFSYHGYFKYMIDLFENPEKYQRRIYKGLEGVSTDHILKMNGAERQRHIYEIHQDKKRADQYIHQIYYTILKQGAYSYDNILCIFRTKEIPIQIMHPDIIGPSREFSPQEVHFSHRISPKQIIGVIMDVTGDQERDLAILNLCKRYAKPLYDNRFKLIWPV